MNISNVGKALLAAVIAAVFCTATVSEARAEAGPKVRVSILSQKEVTVMKDGKEAVETVPADKVKPGDVLVYTVTYENTGDGEAKNAALVDPVPRNTVYVVGSAAGDDAEITCSIDGGNTYHTQPVKVTVTLPDGTTRERDADPEAYTHVRWVIKSIPPGGSGTVSFKTQVE